MQLKQRVQKVKSGRRTMKRSQKQLQVQKGGADWIDFSATKVDWEPILKTRGIWDSVSELFAVSHPEENNGKLMRHYLNAIMMQDELMDAAMELTLSKSGVPGVTNTFDSIADNIGKIDVIDRETFLKYVLDVQRMGSFFVTPNNEIDADAENRSKLEMIRVDETELNSSLLLFPDRLKNIFISAFATIAIQMKYAPSSIIKTDKVDNSSISTLQAELYTSYIEGLAMMKTGRPLRDGFYLDESIREFREYLHDNQFLLHLIEALRGLIKSERTAFDLTCNTYVTDSEDEDFIKLTADILYTYIKAGSTPFDVTTILNIFNKDECTVFQDDIVLDRIKSEDEQKYIPNHTGNELLYRALVEGTTVTYLQLLTHMRPYALNYMIHLCHTIQKLEPSVKSLVEPPTAATSGAAAAAAAGAADK